MTTDPLTDAETVTVVRAMLEKQIANIRAKPLFYGFVVAGTRDLSPVYTTGFRFQLFGDVLAILNIAQARKVAANFNRKAADSGEDLQTYRFMPYENWARARVAFLQSMLDKLAVLD